MQLEGFVNKDAFLYVAGNIVGKVFEYGKTSVCENLRNTSLRWTVKEFPVFDNRWKNVYYEFLKDPSLPMTILRYWIKLAVTTPRFGIRYGLIAE
jgi:hypothetical protein